MSDKIACFPRRNGAAFSSAADALLKLNLVTDNCSSAVENFFSEKTCFGNENCKKNFGGDNGALHCLKDFGDVAFMNLETFKNLTGECELLINFSFLNLFVPAATAHFNRKSFRVICPFAEKNKYLKGSDICHLSWTSKGVLLTNKAKSQIRINEIVNTLKTMDNHFGKHKYRSGNIPFTLFGPFDQKQNVLFKDSTDGLKTKFEFTRITNFERNLESYFELSSELQCNLAISLNKSFNFVIALISVLTSINLDMRI